MTDRSTQAPAPTHIDPLHLLIHEVIGGLGDLIEHPSAVSLDEQRLAYHLADEAVVADIEGHALPVGNVGWDVRPMLDLREWGPEIVDMHAVALTYALERRLIESVPGQLGLVRMRKPFNANQETSKA